MEENLLSSIVDGRITDIRFSVATHAEVCTSSISEAPINHPSQLTNPFLGLPLESGKCESCGTAEPGKCEGHFGYIELPIPIYHPCHVSELKKLLSMVCLKCLRLKRGKNVGSDKSSSFPCSYCKEVPQILINEAKTTDGVILLELKLARKSCQNGQVWNFLDKYGYRYGDGRSRTLLPCEVLEILKRFPEETRNKLSAKGYFTQDGYILQKLPVPPNCLSIPDISDGVSIMSCDISVSMLRKVLKQADIIKSSRSGRPNFESHKVEVNDLQSTVAQYLRARGTAKDTRDIKMRSGASKEADESATKAWLEKMRTYFISKGSGYCSRSVITGDAYKKVNEIGLPSEVAQRITFEEKVTECNKVYLQDLVDKKLCLTYMDGASMYSLREGTKGHTFLRVGQVVHRRIMDGDVVFINRPPSTHKHSLQALSVYVHDDHTVKINPLICGPLDADFDGDCVHLFYPQSLAARSEVLELFSVEQQLLSSHSGSLNLQLKNDSLLSLKILFKNFFLDKVKAQQLAMFIPRNLPKPSLLKGNSFGSQWTVLQLLETVLPGHFDCLGERYLIKQSEILKLDFNRDAVQAMFHDIITSVLYQMGSKEALKVFDCLQPLLMESLFVEGYSVCLKDFYVPMSAMEHLPKNIEKVSRLLHQLRSKYNELVELQVGNDLRSAKAPVVNFILKLSGLGNLIDSKSESSINKVVEQIGFLGLQLSDRGKFYSSNLVEDMTALFLRKYAVDGVNYPSEAFGLIKSCFFHGLNPYESLVHSISSREVLVRSSRGLTEPGTLFKNLMTVLRDVVICYDNTVRNVCSNSIIQFGYSVDVGADSHRLYPAGEPVGALAATAISNPSYKAVLDSSSSSNTSWGLMKEVLVCKVNFVNDLNDRRVILYLNDCFCGKKHCKENAAYLVQNQLKRVSLRNIAVNFLIEYQNQQSSVESQGTHSSLVGHIHLDKKCLIDLDLSMHELLLRCRETITLAKRSRKSRLFDFLKDIFLTVSECCGFQQSYDSMRCQLPCLQFSWRLDKSESSGFSLETTSQIMANMICPFLLDTIIKGDRRVTTANIIWISPDTPTWVTDISRNQNGELAVELVLEKEFIKHHGDAWRLALDSCLPVMHLIDTRRSIPYAIRQVQEVLGISCAFDQAVQRLSTSIKMVSKGVLKEHLILAVNSMTCTGSLIGFNKGGYKALFRSLNVQIPFTEATLFTPRKCFERAAEKCHTDTLSGIVASCSWGKHVAVGSGTRFEILWNTKEMGADNNSVIDVYNFLQLVRMSSTGGESNTSCLGEDFDDLEIQNGIADLSMSPEQNFDVSKPTFDDAEIQCTFEEDQAEDKRISSESGWEKGVCAAKSGLSSEWKVEQRQDVENGVTWGKPNDSSAWGVSTDAALHTKKPVDSWGGATAGEGWNGGESQKLPPKESTDAWGKQTGESDRWSKQNDCSALGATAGAGWNATESQKLPAKESANANWNNSESQKYPPPEQSSDVWGKETRDTNPWSQPNNSSSWGALADAGREVSESKRLPSKEPTDAWGKQTPESDAIGWDKNSSRGGWTNNGSTQDEQERALPQNGWGKSAEENKPSGGWKQPEKVHTSHGWNSESATRWTKKEEQQDELENQLPCNNWGDKAETKPSGDWNEPTSSPNWDSPSDKGWKDGNSQTEQGKNSSWGRGKKQGWGSSNSGDWKRNNRPAKSGGRFDDRNARGGFTPTRSRSDQYTSEEQKILTDVEPIMLSLRRIMHQSGYNDGDPLSADDQSFILDNVFNYHPDKAGKMGLGVDYVMISKHTNYQDTRCLYIVKANGDKEDFSYKKCLENFVKEKYPEIAASFNGKYFSRKPPRSRGVPGQEDAAAGSQWGQGVPEQDAGSGSQWGGGGHEQKDAGSGSQWGGGGSEQKDAAAGSQWGGGGSEQKDAAAGSQWGRGPPEREDAAATASQPW